MIPPDLLTSREIASAFYLAVIVALLIALAIRKPEVRESLARLLKLRLPLELVLLVGLFAGWLALVIRGAGHIGLWNEGLAKDTIFWFVVPGLGLFVSLGDVGQPGLFCRRLWRTLGLSVFVAFYLNVLTFHIAIEVALQPIATVLGAAATFANAPAGKRRAERLLALFGFALLAATTLNMIANSDRIDGSQVILSWFLPVWLTVAALPFVYLLGLYDQYRVLFRLADKDAPDWRARLRARLALPIGYGAVPERLRQSGPISARSDGSPSRQALPPPAPRSRTTALSAASRRSGSVRKLKASRRSLASRAPTRRTGSSTGASSRRQCAR